MTNDQQARRQYWTNQMDAAFDFMQQMREYPVEECGEPMASMPVAAAEAGLEVQFSTSKIAFDLDRVFFLRVGLIEGFLAAAKEMNQRGWILKIEDGFRSVLMQQSVSRRPLVFDGILKTTMWELDGAVPTPEFMLKRVSALTATRPKIGTHMSGSAIDISVFRKSDGSEVDRGKPYLEMSELTPMLSPFISAEARQNRQVITEIMERHGFVHYPFEFWHYNSGDCYGEALTGTGKPGRYGAVNWNPADNSVEAIADPQELLQPHEAIQREIDMSLERLAKA